MWLQCLKRKGLFTPSESKSEREKDQRINKKHRRKILLSLMLSFDVNGPSGFLYIGKKAKSKATSLLDKLVKNPI